MFGTVQKNQRRRVSIVELAVVIGILVILAAVVVTLAGNHRDRPKETVPAAHQAPASTTINPGIPVITNG